MSKEHSQVSQEIVSSRRKRLKQRLARTAEKLGLSKKRGEESQNHLDISWLPSEYATLGIAVEALGELGNRQRISVGHELGLMTIEHQEGTNSMELVYLDVKERARQNKHLDLAFTLMGLLKRYTMLS